jgi:AcrR family transcriptional regulator
LTPTASFEIVRPFVLLRGSFWLSTPRFLSPEQAMTLTTALQSLRPPRPPARSGRGGQTRSAIVERALALARREGLEGLTIGSLAAEMSMSKSGVFAHFGSREELQLAVLREYALRFVDDVLRPAVRAARGLPRLQAIVENWVQSMARELEQGCLLVGGASEYDDRPGLLHDAMVSIVEGWIGELRRAIEQARDEGHLQRDVDAEQLVFEIYGMMLALHQETRLLRSPRGIGHARAGLARLLASVAAPPRASDHTSKHTSKHASKHTSNRSKSPAAREPKPQLRAKSTTQSKTRSKRRAPRRAKTA